MGDCSRAWSIIVETKQKGLTFEALAESQARFMLEDVTKHERLRGVPAPGRTLHAFLLGGHRAGP